MSKKTLVVDDMATMRKIVKKCLSNAGYKDLVEADDGIPAWKLIEEAHAAGAPFEFIVSDWNMPGMTGLDLLKKVRADARFAKTPFLMVTAEGEKKNVVAAVQAGVTNFIMKPFNEETFGKKLATIFK